MVQGHAHPVIGAAMNERYALGTHFAAPTEDAIAVGEELAARSGLPKWRYTNSGSEATMDAIRIARAHTGRDMVLKIFGSYHGHHDTVMVSIGVDVRPDRRPRQPRLAARTARASRRPSCDLTVAVPFNDAGAMERRIERLAAEGRLPACVIMEAAMMNLGVVLPEPGYLEAVRELTTKHGIVLIFDEVKTGLCVAAGGAIENFGVVPDMVTLAKALGAGLPSARSAAPRRSWPASRTAASTRSAPTTATRLRWPRRGRACRRCSRPTPTRTLNRLNDRMLEGCGAVIEKYRLPGYAVGIGSKGCVTFSPARVVDYETFKAHQDGELTELSWLWNMNRGIFTTPGREEEWTLSVQHTDEAVDRYVAVFEELAHELGTQ